MTKLEKILTVLQNDYTTNRISEQIDNALKNYNPKKDIKTHNDFNNELSRFIQHLFLNGLPIPRNISLKKALSEAINLLEQYYECQGAIGYDAAYLEAVSPSGKGFNFVLTQLTETLKNIEISRYTNWLHAALINPSDWKTQRKIVEELINNYRRFLPNEIVNRKPIYFVKHYRDLIETIISSKNIIDKIS